MAIPWLSCIPTAARWLWNKIRGRPTVQADRGAVAAGRDQTISDSIITAQQALQRQIGTLVAASQHFHAPVTIINLSRYAHELPDIALEGPPESYKEGERLQAAGDHAGAIAQYEKAFVAAREDYNRCVLHMRIARSFRDLNRRAEAEGHLLQALDLARRSGERKAEAFALLDLGVANYADGNSDRGEAYSREALETFRALGHESGTAHVMTLLGLVYRRQDRSDEAAQYLTQAIDTWQRLRDEKLQALCLYDLANVYRERGDPAALGEAEDLNKRALQIYENLGDRKRQAATLYNLALVYDSRTDPERAHKAEDCYLAASELYRADGDVPHHAQALNKAGRASSTRGDQPAALERCSHALALFEQAGHQKGTAEALANLGIIHLERARQALDNLDATHPTPAQIQQLQEHAEEAHQHIVRSLALYQQLGDLPNEAFGTVVLSSALLLRQDLAGAKEKLRHAQELFSQAGDEPRARSLDDLIDSLDEDFTPP